MAYTLQAILSQSATLDRGSIRGTRVVLLRSGVSMLPLGKAFLEAHAAPFLPLTDAGDGTLPPTIASVCSRLAECGEVAYVEAEFHGGEGIQAAVVFHQGGSHDPPRAASDAIKVALRALGVRPPAGVDEFSAVGLGAHRETDQWLSAAGA